MPHATTETGRVNLPYTSNILWSALKSYQDSNTIRAVDKFASAAANQMFSS